MDLINSICIQAYVNLMSFFSGLADEMLSLGVPMGAVDTIVKNAKNQVTTVGGSILMLLGAVAVIVAGYKIVTGLMSHGKKETNWFVIIILIIVGGALLVGGFTVMEGISSFGKDAIEELF